MKNPSQQSSPITNIVFSAPALPAVGALSLLGAAEPEMFSLSLATPPPGLLTLPMTPWNTLVKSFQFSSACETKPNQNAPERLNEQPQSASSFPIPHSPLRISRASTRIRPPRDTLRLEDRLQMLLQPSLETLIARDALHFPLTPFPYQLQGVAFLYPRFAAVLADEMGLGKTMQAITALRMLLHSGEISNALLVCPKPLVTNWQREFGVWAPELPVTVIEGDPQRRDWQWRLGEAPVKIANYELLCRDVELLADEQLQFDLVVLDEAQRIKNRAGVTSEAVRSISRRRSWALTGTPVENSPEDLVGIFEFVAPRQISSKMKPRALGRAISDFVLRRMKDDVLSDLPPKLCRDAEVTLTPQQRQSYKLAEDKGILRLTELGDSVTIHHVFELILRLKQICNFDPATGDSSKLERLSADMEEVAASGQKAIVFSQWVGTLQRLKTELAQFSPLEYHGQIPMDRRDQIIEQFRADRQHHVMLMTYGAGGVGLNLQFSNYVFLFDRWWNPAVEDQAINRAHRIGVDGPVTVTRFLTLGTIEERINQVLEEKRELFDTIFTDAATPKTVGLSQQEIFGLFNLRCPQGKIEVNNAEFDAA